jgi:diaminopimelate epimerase
MSLVAVTKMHGTFNDFVVLDQRPPTIDDLSQFARRICDRRGGVGADGLIVLLDSAIADARMRIINADGSEAEMCGNGMRCAIRYLSECGEGDRFRIETLAGIVGAEVVEKGETYEIRLELGTPVFEPRPLTQKNAAFVLVGNPHVVLFERSLDAIDLVSVAEELQGSPAFPEGTNVHVAVPLDRGRIDVRHWERGVGLTYACGTGSVACAAAAMRLGFADDSVEVRVPGGRLRVEWDGVHQAYLTGPAVRVFDAQVRAVDAVPV